MNRPSLDQTAVAAGLTRAQRWAIVRAQAERILARKFDPNQPRDEDGRWTDTGGGAGGGSKPHPQGELFPGAFPPIPEPAKPVGDDDFKDKVKLGQNMTDKQKQDFFKEWDSRVAEAPEEFRSEFMGGLNGTMTISIDYDGGWNLSGNLLDDDGAKIGTYTRAINFKENKATSSYFSIDRAHQNKDIGKKMLAANVAKYQELGLDAVEVHANIDVGGYAWAKYGYVPSRDSWRDLSASLYDKIGGPAFTPEEWDQLSRDQQNEIRDAWKRETHDEFYQSEVDNWHESGRALDDAKAELAEEWEKLPADNVPMGHWSWMAVNAWRRGQGANAPTATNDEILNGTLISYDRDYEGRNDANIVIEPVEGLSEDQRADLESALVIAFSETAKSRENFMDPPADLEESVSDYQNEYWDSMNANDKFKWAEDNGLITEAQDESEFDSETADDLRYLIDDGDPKAIWAIADSEHGKDLLLGTDWYGVLDLTDSDTMERFNAYVGKGQQQAA